MTQPTRRRFITDTGKAAMAGTLILAANSQQTEMKDIFVHHVYFWLKNAGNKEDLDKLVAGLKKLSAVKTIKQFHIGKPAGTKRDVIETSYAVSWLVFFANGTDQASYQTDPIHLKFVEDCSSLWQKVVVYDSVNI
ncbi:MAG TPA: Dabb family protein [Chitinophagaceae bacterium]|nr:Dabb family protein [Chitinophagaceae bacterium]